MTDSNFSFLANPWTSYAENCAAAEKLFYTDPSSCIAKLGNFAECVTRDILDSESLPVPKSQFERINILKEKNIISVSIADALHTIRKARNETDHENMNTHNSNAETCLRCAYRIAKWFASYYGMSYPNVPFEMPPYPQTSPSSYHNTKNVVTKPSSHTTYSPITSISSFSKSSNIQSQYKKRNKILSFLNHTLLILLIISIIINILQFLIYHY